MVFNARTRIMLAEDAGIDVGSILGGDEGAEGGGGEPPKPEKRLAKYASQLPKAWQDDDCTGVEDIPSLYEKYRKLEKDSKDMVRIPGKDSKPEDVKAFLKRLGMPDSVDGYELSDYDIEPEKVAASKKNFLNAAMGAGLTKAQAKAMWKDRLADMKSAETVLKGQIEEGRKNFRPGLEGVLKADYPDDAKRKERADREEALYKEFVADTGLGEAFSKAFLDISPDAVHRIALYQEKARKKSGMDGFGGEGGEYPTKSGIEALAGMYKMGS